MARRLLARVVEWVARVWHSWAEVVRVAGVVVDGGGGVGGGVQVGRVVGAGRLWGVYGQWRREGAARPTTCWLGP